MTPGHKFGKNTYVKKFVSRFQCIFVENRYTNYCLHLRNVKLLSVGGQNSILVLHKNWIYWQYLEIHVLFNFLNKRFQHRNLGLDIKGSISQVISFKREGMRLYMCLDTISFEWLFLIFVLSRHKKYYTVCLLLVSTMVTVNPFLLKITAPHFAIYSNNELIIFRFVSV